MSCTPLWLAAICYAQTLVKRRNPVESWKRRTALRSLSTSRIFLQPELPGYWLGLSTMYSTSPFWSKIPPSTILKLSISAPSSNILTDVGGIEPGRMPPISAWWPLEAVKKIISLVFESNTGVIIVISGRCLPRHYHMMKHGGQTTYEPPAWGEFVIKTSPSLRVFPCNFIWYLTALHTTSSADTNFILARKKSHKLIDPKWIGINGALATKSPSGANKAQEKSNLSLMFVLMEVCCRERPIASATLIKRFAKRVSKMGSGPFVELLNESRLGIGGL
jgi:hypothetical protein